MFFSGSSTSLSDLNFHHYLPLQPPCIPPQVPGTLTWTLPGHPSLGFPTCKSLTTFLSLPPPLVPPLANPLILHLRSASIPRSLPSSSLGDSNMASQSCWSQARGWEGKWTVEVWTLGLIVSVPWETTGVFWMYSGVLGIHGCIPSPSLTGHCNRPFAHLLTSAVAAPALWSLHSPGDEVCSLQVSLCCGLIWHCGLPYAVCAPSTCQIGVP